jgi:hypothetical protein
MNERIKLLAAQASDDGDHIHYYNPAFAEKFAELIVRECADFLKDTLDDHFAAEQLEEHFGVEE